MEENVTVQDIMVPDINTIGPDEPVRDARRRMESQALRSLIVAQMDKPIGIIEWRSIMKESAAPGDQPVREFMRTEFPVVRTGMPATEARTHMVGVDVDRIPVVNDNGDLVGEVPRTSLAHLDRATGAAPAPGDEMLVEGATAAAVDTRGDEVVTTVMDERVVGPELRSGMNVVGSSGTKLGSVDEVLLDEGQPSAFTVEHGFLSKKHKKIPADVIDHVEGDDVVLAIDSTEFKMLGNIEDET